MNAMSIRALTVRFRRSSAMAVQLTAVAVANLAAFALRFDGAPPDWAAAACAQMLPWLLLIRGLTFVPFRLYDGLWRYAGIYDLRAIVFAVFTSSVVFAAVTQSSFGPLALKSRWTRSGRRAACGSGLVVRHGLPRRFAPTIPCSRINRCTRQRGTCSPARCSVFHIRR